MKFNKILMPLATVIGSTLAVTPTISSCGNNENEGYIDLMNCTEEEFKSKMQLAEPLKADEHELSVNISQSDPEAGVRPMYKINDYYGEMFSKNKNYFIQDILYLINNKMQYLKQSPTYNLTGSFQLKFGDISLKANKVVEDGRKQLLLCNMVGYYKADLKCDDPWDEIDTITIKLEGKLVLNNIYAEIVAKTREAMSWSNHNIKIWSSTHETAQGELASRLISTAEGSIVIQEKGKEESITLTRKSSDPITYVDPDYPIAWEELYKDPIVVLLAALDEDKSYSFNDLKVKLNYVA